MFENFKTTKYLRQLADNGINDKFLASLRDKLSAYIKANPAPASLRIGLVSRVQFLNMRYATVALVIIIAIMSGGGVAFASLGSLPGDRLYGIKTLTEDMRVMFAFTPEAKRALEEKLASERVGEIESLMALPELSQEKIDAALTRLDQHMDDTAKIIESERAKGVDVNMMAQQVGEQFAREQARLEQIFKNRGLEISAKEQELEKALATASSTGDMEGADKISEELNKIKRLQDTVDKSRNNIDANFANKTDVVEKGVEAQTAAEKAIADAKNAEAAFIDEAAKQKWTITEDDLKTYNDFIEKADDAMAKEHFVQARQFARQAKGALKRLNRSQEKDDHGLTNPTGDRQDGSGEGRENDEDATSSDNQKTDWQHKLLLPIKIPKQIDR